MSERAEEPLLDLNCGALPPSLIESQLFGHERGAFTGADRPHDGYLTAVRRGTFFLDEIAELPFDTRVVKPAAVMKLGGGIAEEMRQRFWSCTAGSSAA